MKIKGIIFDLDGVLVHTDKYHYLAWKEMADKEDIYFNEEINHLLRGVSRLESLNIILRNAKKTYTEEQKLELVNFKNKIYREYLSKMTKNDVSSDVLKTLNELKQRKFKLAVGS
ncbi:TPA: HAD hydrolase-like protein, partial [bacterium]|nr:HAD hydrolase-like protein [bacterium]